MFLQKVPNKSPDEIGRQVYEETQINPVRGEWTKLIKIIKKSFIFI